MTECINKCTPYEYENPLSPKPTESDLVQVYDSIEQITNPNSNHIYVVGNDVYVFDGVSFLHTNECNIPPYTGDYTVIAPSEGNLVLPTKDTLMTDDLTIEANLSGYSIDDIASGAEPSGDIVINSTSIQRDAFIFRTNIESVTLTNLVNTNSANCLQGCTGLTSFSAPLMETCGAGFLADCVNLENLNLPSLVSTSQAMLQGCNKLTNIWFPNVTNIPSFFLNGRAYGSPRMTVKFGKKITTMASNAFNGISNNGADIYFVWEDGEVAGAPWGAPTTVTFHYNTVFDEDGNVISSD